MRTYGRDKKRATFYSKIPKGRGHLKDIGVGEGIILKFI